MNSPIVSILRKATRGDSKLNVLSFATHERYQTGLKNVNADFYLLDGPGVKKWHNKYAPLPANHHIISMLPTEVEFDLVLSQNKFCQFGPASQISQALHIPHVVLEHCLPMDSYGPEELQYFKNMRGDINVFISEFSRKAWGWGEDEAVVIHHGVDSNLFCPKIDAKRQDVILSVANDWVNRDHLLNFRGWQRITQGLPVAVFGDTPGLSKAAKDTNELAQAYRSARVFLNTSLMSPIPSVVLEAMASGCAIVTTATCMLPEIIENGVNGFISNDENYLRQKCVELLKNPELAFQLGVAARNTILDRFSLDKFVVNWNNILRKAANI